MARRGWGPAVRVGRGVGAPIVAVGCGFDGSLAFLSIRLERQVEVGERWQWLCRSTLFATSIVVVLGQAHRHRSHPMQGPGRQPDPRCSNCSPLAPLASMRCAWAFNASIGSASPNSARRAWARGRLPVACVGGGDDRTILILEIGAQGNGFARRRCAEGRSPTSKRDPAQVPRAAQARYPRECVSLDPAPGLQRRHKFLHQGNVGIRESVCAGVVESLGGDGRRRLGAEDGQSAGSQARVLFDAVGFGGHENIIGFVICAEGIGGEVEEIDRIDDPAIGKPDANACDAVQEG